MYKCINGWTKEKMIEHVLCNFTGQSLNSNNFCMYRGMNNTKCGVGMFIPDEKYKLSMEDITAEQVIDDYKLQKFMPLNPSEMDIFQFQHDSGKNDEDAFYRMIDFIEKNVED